MKSQIFISKTTLKLSRCGLLVSVFLAIVGDTRAQSFTNTDSLNMARGNQTATLLQNGSILVAGGTTNGVVPGINPPTASAEIYDPVSGTWKNTGAMALARYEHTATLLPNGKLLVADGVGYSNNSTVELASAELYDPVSGLWSATGTPNQMRHGHTATLLSNGMVLIAGGYDATSALDSAELYDPDTQTWTNTGTLNFPRGHQAAALLPNGKVLVAGGSSTNCLSSAEVYDPVSGTWAVTSAMSVARSGMPATLLPDGTVLFAGGATNIDFSAAEVSSAEIYSYSTGTWQLVGSMSVARWGAMATLLTTGNVLVAGGSDGNYLASAELYNPLTKVWTTAGLMSVAREGGTATLLNDWRVLFAGGTDGVVYLASAELYFYPPQTATGTASLTNGFVVGVNITDGGDGYTNTPLVRLIGGGGSGAETYAVVSNGVVTSITVTDAGYGYTNAPLVVIEPPFIPNPVLGIAPMSFLPFSNLTVGGVYQLQQSVAWYWSNQPVSFTATNALYTQMVAGVWGSGDFRLALNPVPAQAFATPEVVNGFVVGATVTAGGSGYVTTPAVNIYGDIGSNATAVASISGGVVTNITITDAGIGYTNFVEVQIAPPPAAAVSPTVQPVMQINSANLAPYDNYQIEFEPDLGGAWSNWDGGLFSPTDVTNSQYLFITNRVGFFRLQYEP